MDTKKVYLFLAGLLGIKLGLAWLIPVFGDEAYYYVWSQHPQLSYFDHPAMVSWLISLSHMLLPAGHALTLRFPFILLSFLTSVVWIKILNKKHFSTHKVIIFLILMFLNPLLGIGSVAATPDVPLVFFWSLSYLLFLDLFETKRLLTYGLLGVTLGLGFCSKYHIVIFVISGLLYIVLTKKYDLLRVKGILLTLLFGTLFSLPVVIWNSQNQWQSFAFQLDHGFGEESFSWAWPVGYLIAQTFIANPFVLFAVIKNKVASTEKIFSLSQLGFFLISSFKSVVEGNWPITSHLHSIAAFAEIEVKKLIRYSFVFWFIFYILLGGFLISPASEKVRKNLVNASQLNDIYPLVSQFRPLYGASYQVAALLSWKTQQKVPKLGELSRFDFYDSLPESRPTDAVFYVLKNDYSHWPEKYNLYKKIKIQSFDNVGLELYQFSYE